MIPTANEFMSDEYQMNVYSRKITNEEKAIEFARMHCEAQAKEIVKTIEDESQGDWYNDDILKSYPLTNIK